VPSQEDGGGAGRNTEYIRRRRENRNTRIYVPVKTNKIETNSPGKEKAADRAASKYTRQPVRVSYPQPSLNKPVSSS
jgi:hypothetical protein